MTLLIFLIILSILVLIHEAGHYFAARIFKVKADEFGYGLPPRVGGIVKVGKKWKWVGRKDEKEYANTIWSLNWLPIGGFVRIKGEQGDPPSSRDAGLRGGGGAGDADSFHVKPIWQRIAILAAGVGMNWVLAAVLLSVALMVGAPSVLEDLPAGATVEKREVTIIETLPDSPAERAGIRAGDVIVRVGPEQVETLEQARSLIADQGERKFTLLIVRDGVEEYVTLSAEYLEEAGREAIGVGLVDTGEVRYPFFQAIQGGVILTGVYTKAVVLTFLDLFRELLDGKTDTASHISGPVGIAVTTGHIAKQGFVALLNFTAILSINLAVVNFLPIPALDGGRAVFLIVEGVRRKPMNRRLEAIIHNVSFLILIGLILLVTVRDLGKYGAVIVGGLKGLIGI